MLTLEVIAYILSLAFQVAGAVLLIIKYWGKTLGRIIDEYFPGSNVIERDDSNNVTLEKEKVQICAQKVYDNRMAFVFIAIGYILSIFGAANESCQYCILLCVILGTIFIILLEKIITISISKKLYSENVVMAYDKIQNKADTIYTEAEIQGIIDRAFEDK